MTSQDFIHILKILEEQFPSWDAPVVQMMKRGGESPYRVLITTILSLRSRDERTIVAADQLFRLADTPEDMLRVPPEDIREAIFVIGFYIKKTETILDISRDLLQRFGGKVPSTQKELLSLKGVGLKTANLILSTCFGQPYICVDIHVHRICNRLGFLQTQTADKTEKILSQKIKEKSWWSKINYLLVGFGQTICKPVSPLCSRCPVYSQCARIGVSKTR